MLQLNYIRQHVDLVKERLGVKHYADIASVDRIVSLDEQVRHLKVETESMQAALNASSKEIGILMGQGKKEEAEKKKLAVSEGKSGIHRINAVFDKEDLKFVITVQCVPPFPPGPHNFFQDEQAG